MNQKLRNLKRYCNLTLLYCFPIIIIFWILGYFIDTSFAMAIAIILYVLIAAHGATIGKYTQYHRWIMFWAYSFLIGQFYIFSSQWYDYFMLLLVFICGFNLDNIMQKQIKSKLDN